MSNGNFRSEFQEAGWRIFNTSTGYYQGHLEIGIAHGSPGLLIEDCDRVDEQCDQLNKHTPDANFVAEETKICNIHKFRLIANATFSAAGYHCKTCGKWKRALI